MAQLSLRLLEVTSKTQRVLPIGIIQYQTINYSRSCIITHVNTFCFHPVFMLYKTLFRLCLLLHMYVCLHVQQAASGRADISIDRSFLLASEQYTKKNFHIIYLYIYILHPYIYIHMCICTHRHTGNMFGRKGF